MGSQWYKVCMECVYGNKYREHLQVVYRLTKNAREPSISNGVLYEYLDCSPHLTTLVMVPFWHNSTNDSLKWYDPLSEMLWPLGMHKNIQYKSKRRKSAICTSDISRRKINFTEQLTTGIDVSFSPGSRVSCASALLAHIFDFFLTLYYIIMLYIYTHLLPLGPATLRNMDEKNIPTAKIKLWSNMCCLFSSNLQRGNSMKLPLRMEMTESFIMSPLGLGPTTKLMSLMTLASFGRRVWRRPREHGLR